MIFLPPRRRRLRTALTFAVAINATLASLAVASPRFDELPPKVALGETTLAPATVAAIEASIAPEAILADVSHLA